MTKIAYLILAHADPMHLRRLCAALDYRSRIFVHIDLKSDIDDFLALDLPPHVTLIKDRVDVRWAGISMVDATLNLMRAAIDSDDDLYYFALLSGADYPLRSAKRIWNELMLAPHREHIRFIDMRASTHYRRQIEQRWFFERRLPGRLRHIERVWRKGLHMLRLPNQWRSEATPYFGSQWWILTRRACEYILAWLAANPWFYAMNRDTFSPDEHFFHTVIGNSPLLADSGGIQPFEGVGTWRLSNKTLIHPSLQKIYTASDWPDIQAQMEHFFFIRKLRSGASSSLCDLIDAHAAHRDDTQ